MNWHPSFLFLMFKNMLFKSLFTLLAHSSYVLCKIIYVYHLIYFLKYFSYSYAEGMEGKKSSSSNQSSLSSFRIKQWVSLKYMESKFWRKLRQMISCYLLSLPKTLWVISSPLSFFVYQRQILQCSQTSVLCFWNYKLICAFE